MGLQYVLQILFLEPALLYSFKSILYKENWNAFFNANSKSSIIVFVKVVHFCFSCTGTSMFATYFERAEIVEFFKSVRAFGIYGIYGILYKLQKGLSGGYSKYTKMQSSFVTRKL